jgi:osmotically inducible protein OsmC
MSIEKVLYKAQVTTTGGRIGNSKSSDGALEVNLTTPKELGGPGGTGTNPEQLFAAGYSALLSWRDEVHCDAGENQSS